MTEQLIEWFRDPSNKAYWNEDLVSIRKSPLGGVGVFAIENIEHDGEDDEENLLLRISKQSILSGKNSFISNLLHECGVDSHLGLILAFLYEKSLGSDSPWYAYLQTIQHKNSEGLILPVHLWPAEKKKLLIGTEMYSLLDNFEEETEGLFESSVSFAREYESVLKVPTELDVNESNTREKLLEFAAITLAIASRSFNVDNYHELALVPGADLFNHDSYGKEHVHFEALGDVCPFCSSVDECGHIEHGAPDSEIESDLEEEVDDEEDEEDEGDEVHDEEDNAEDRNEENGEESTNEPFEVTEDYIAKMEEELEREDISDDEAQASEDEEQDNSDNEMCDIDQDDLLIPDLCCDIKIVNSIPKNTELLNTYGDLNNTSLLTKYGFTSVNNPNDYVSLGDQALNQLKNFPDRKNWWDSKGYEVFNDYLHYTAQMNQEERENEGADEEEEKKGHEHGEEGDDQCHSDAECHSCDGDSQVNSGACCDSCDGGNDEEEEEEEEVPPEYLPWQVELRVNAEGRPSQSTYALARLLSLSEAEFLELTESDDKTLFLEKISVLESPEKAAYQNILDWCKQRSTVYQDGGLTSNDYEKAIRSTKNSQKLAISILVLGEKKVLEQSLASLTEQIN
ncbi:BA75_00909T0 [Komagataella pastoris]|uniref:BA75_00909T0 n=1 Tax=Komagataella pastoris TaxID=4922 RepID=A0A1B2J973_PICPA|nr:BA75_00909T0 [Komagataella pastoris]